MILYLSPFPRSAPSGGVRLLYNQAEALTAAGLDAEVLEVPHGSNPDMVRLPAEMDLLMVPEVYGDLLRTIAPGVPRISLNQNAHMSWSAVSRAPHPYRDTGTLRCVLCVSEHNRRFLQHAFPGVRVERFVPAIDERFQPGPYPRLQRICGFFQRRRAEHAQMVLTILAGRGALEGWQVVDMTGMDDGQVVSTLQDSAIFLSFSQLEGLPAPPREALACGCLVVGYTGLGAEEIVSPAWWRVLEDDVVGFAMRVELAQRRWLERTERMVRYCEAASRWARREYSRERELATVRPVIEASLSVPA